MNVFPGKILQTYRRKSDVDRNCVKNIYVKLFVYLQLVSGQMWELGSFQAEIMLVMILEQVLSSVSTQCSW